MNTETWHKTASGFRPAIRRLMERLSEQETDVKLEECLKEDDKKTLKLLKGYEILKSAEENFQVELIVGFSGDWQSYFSGSNLAEENDGREMPGPLYSAVTGFLAGLVKSAMKNTGFQFQMDPFLQTEVKKGHSLLNLQSYFISRWNIKPFEEDGNKEGLDLLIAFSTPGQEILDRYSDGFSDIFDASFVKAAVRAADQLGLAGDAGGTGSQGNGHMNGSRPVNSNRPAPGNNGSGGAAVEFEPFDKDLRVNPLSESGNINLLKNVEMNVSVELGRKQISLGKILQLVKGSVVELDKLAGEPVNILVNGRSIAVGDVVVIDEHFGVRISGLLAAHETIAGGA